MAKGDDMQERLVDLAVGIIVICKLLPKTEAGRHVAGQLLRSGTSPASNYAEARGAESRRDFVHKMGVVLKELNETQIWLQIARRSALLSIDSTESVLKDCVELSRIINAGIRTARERINN